MALLISLIVVLGVFGYSIMKYPHATKARFENFKCCINLYVELVFECPHISHENIEITFLVIFKRMYIFTTIAF